MTTKEAMVQEAVVNAKIEIGVALAYLDTIDEVSKDSAIMAFDHLTDVLENLGVTNYADNVDEPNELIHELIKRI